MQVVRAGYLLGNAHDLAAVAHLVVIPDIEVGAVAVDDGGLRIEDAGRTRTDEVRRHHFRGVGVVDLILQVGVQRDLAQELVDLFLARGLFQRQAEDAMDTFGVGTRIELPVSLPSSSGSALATALAAPVSVMTMLSTAERPRRSALW